MRQSKFWEFVQVIGALASIICGLILLLSSQTGAGIAFVLVTMVGVFAVIVASIMARRGPQVVGRNAMIHTGCRLIRNIKKEAIMFGGDMSWASDYEEAIRSTASTGKRIRVLYPRSDANKVRRNEQILKNAGAELLPTPIDSGLRALLVDPEEPKDALLYVVTRTLRSGAVPVQVGEYGSESTYQYLAKIHTMEQDWVVIQATRKIYEVLSATSQGRE